MSRVATTEAKANAIVGASASTGPFPLPFDRKIARLPSMSCDSAAGSIEQEMSGPSRVMESVKCRSTI